MTSRAVPTTIVVAGIALLGSLVILSSCGRGIPAESQWMSHVRALSDDHTRGRESTLEGYREASDYVARELKAYGVEPMGDSGTYFQRVPFVARTVDESRSELTLVQGRRTYPLTLGEDALLSMKLDPAATVNARLVFVGYGLQVPEDGYDDLAGLDLKGAIAVIMAGGPKNVKGPLLAHYSSPIEQWKPLHRAGAGAGQVAERRRRLGAAARGGQVAVGRPSRQGERDLRRGRRLYRVEDQPPRRHGHRIEAVAAALAAACRDQPFAAVAEERSGALAARASAAETAPASAPTVKGLRSSSLPRRSSLSPSPT